MDRRSEVTALLNEVGRGHTDAVPRVLPLVYDELCVLARRHRFRWRDAQSPGTGSLVHEAYLKLVDQRQVRWESRAQFFTIASRVMRSILVDNARYFSRQKRGGPQRQVPLEDHLLVSEEYSAELLALDDALSRLSAADERLGRIVECRFFGGLTVEESAEALGISPATVKRGWTTARAWLYQQLTEGAGPAPAGAPE